jgi:glycosyltransferase involved in cell wall biosynthesis
VRIGLLSQALPYLPSRGGFRLYGANLMRWLSKRHEIDLISLLQDDDGEHLEWAQQFCVSTTWIPTQRAHLPQRIANILSAYLRGTSLHYRARLRSILSEGLRRRQWDVLHIEGSFAGSLVPADLPVAKVLSLHDSWTLRCAEMLQCSQSLREKAYYTFLKYYEPRFERLLYPRFERCVVVADRDAQEVRRIVPNANVAMIPYGTDTEYFHPVPVDKQEATLVFHSHLGYAPNIEAALEFANDIFPLVRREVPNATFHLVGADPGPLIKALAARPGIRISANLPDLRAAVCSARVYVCAIRHGTGLKSKMLEALAMAMPIVAYHPGSTVGIDCVYGEHLLAAENPNDFAAHVVDLLRHPEKAERIALAGRKLVEEKYSWESRAKTFEELCQQAVEDYRRRVGMKAACA